MSCKVQCIFKWFRKEKKKKWKRKKGETSMAICHKIMNFSEDYERLYLSEYI